VVFLNLTDIFLTPTKLFPFFFLSCKANVRLNLVRTEHGPHSFILVVICVVRLLFVLFYALFVRKCLLPPGDNPIAVNIYINMNIVTVQPYCPISLYFPSYLNVVFKIHFMCQHQHDY
jgi:hypothetical protein